MKQDKFSDTYKKLLQKLAGHKYVLAVIIVGLFLLIIPFGRETKEDSGSRETTVPDAVFSLEEQEEKLAAALAEMDGAGSVRVVLTLETGTEQILARDVETSVKTAEQSSESASETETVIVSDGDSNETPVTLKYIYPEYRGALIVAAGAGDSGVRLRLTEAVSALTGLGADRITVTKMKES